jgi:hypothetical protein
MTSTFPRATRGLPVTPSKLDSCLLQLAEVGLSRCYLFATPVTIAVSNLSDFSLRNRKPPEIGLQAKKPHANVTRECFEYQIHTLSHLRQR